MKKNYSILILLLAVTAMLVIALAPVIPESSLSRDGRVALGILVFAIILWMTEAIPFPVTGLALVLLIPAFKLVPFKETVFVGFGNPIIVFFIGIMIMSAALTHSGFTYRLTLLMLDKISLKTNNILFVFLGVGAFLSMWVTNMGVAAILLPIGLEILENSGRVPQKSRFGKALMIAIAWGCGIGGMGTPVGNGANVLAVGFLEELAGIEITFLEWMKYGIPAMLLLLPLAWLILKKVFPPEVEDLPISKEFIKAELRKLGPLSSKERNTLILFSIAIFLWVANPFLKTYFNLDIPIQAVALFVAIAMFLPGVEILNWKEAQENVNWGAIVLIAGGLSLGDVLFNTGGVRWVAMNFFANIDVLNLVFRLVVIVAVVQIIKVFFSSNTATGLVVTPIMISLAQQTGINVWQIVGPAALATSLAFILVPSSPTNVIPYGAGYFTMGDFAKSGIWISLTGVVAIGAVFLLLGS